MPALGLSAFFSLFNPKVWIQGVGFLFFRFRFLFSFEGLGCEGFEVQVSGFNSKFKQFWGPRGVPRVRVAMSCKKSQHC